MTKQSCLCRVTYNFFLVIAILVASSPYSFSQAKPKLKRLPEPIGGTLHSMIPARNMIRVLTNANEPWLVQLKSSTKITVKGEAGIEFLRPGMTVQFYAYMTKKGLVRKPVKEFKAVTLEEGLRLGAIPEEDDFGASSEGEDSEAKDSSDEGEKEEADEESKEESNLDEDETPLKPEAKLKSKKSSKKAAKFKAIKRYWITGVFKGEKKGKLNFAVGQINVRCQAVEGAKVTIDATDLRYAKKNDTVLIKGQYAAQGAAVARSIDVTVVPALEEEKPLSRKKAAAKSRKRKSRSKKKGLEK